MKSSALDFFSWSPGHWIGAALFAVHLVFVVFLLFHRQRLRRLEGDRSFDQKYSLLAALLIYSPIFLSQGWALKIFLEREIALADPLFLLGLFLFLFGFGLRLWAIRTLGRYFTMEIGIREGHELVQSGPYRVLRHPSYTGYILLLLGMGVAYDSWMALALPLSLTLAFQIVRIRKEEEMLHGKFGRAYGEYCQKTSRLFPFIY